MSIVVKNTTQSDIVIVGQVISANGSYTVQPGERYLWANSDDLITKIGSGDVVINDGSKDLTIADATNYVQGNFPRFIAQYALAEGDSLRARLIGIHNGSTATKNTTTDLDWAIPNISYNGSNKQSYMDGIQYRAVNAVDGDTMTFQVIDKDNILGYGANTVLDEFGKDWPVLIGSTDTMKLYKAKLIPGLYIRIKYTSVGTTNDVKLHVGLFRHMDTSVNL